MQIVAGNTREWYGNLNGNYVIMAYEQYSRGGAAPNTSNKAIDGLSFNYFMAAPTSDLANGNVSTFTSYAITPTGIALNMQAPNNNPQFSAISYGITTNAADSLWMRSTRRRGNGATRLSLEPNDYVGNIEWRGATINGNAPTGNRWAKIGARVDSSFVANSSTQPVGLEFWTCDNTTTYTQSFYANGNVNFPKTVFANSANIGSGNILLNSDGNIVANNANIGNGNIMLYANGYADVNIIETSIVQSNTNANVKMFFSGNGIFFNDQNNNTSFQISNIGPSTNQTYTVTKELANSIQPQAFYSISSSGRASSSACQRWRP